MNNNNNDKQHIKLNTANKISSFIISTIIIGVNIAAWGTVGYIIYLIFS